MRWTNDLGLLNILDPEPRRGKSSSYEPKLQLRQGLHSPIAEIGIALAWEQMGDWVAGSELCQTRVRRTILLPNSIGGDGGDSNPRYGNSPYGGLANRWFQPLTHVSGWKRADPEEVEQSALRKGGYISARLQPARRYFAMTSSRISRRIASPGSRTRIPSSGHRASGAFSAALAWVTGSATKMPPVGGE